MNSAEITLDGLRYVLDVESRLQPLQDRWGLELKTNKRWDILRRVYSLKLPDILQHRSDPYFLQWDFTPIERYAWHDIRGLGLPLYPQVPALQYFLDFADPVLQIGVELDGKDFHDAKRDRVRDQALWDQGWRIFRIPGRESLAAPESSEELSRRIIELRCSGETDVEYRLMREWGERWSEGFFWALSVAYYGRKCSEEARQAAYPILDKHRLIDFPLDIDEG